MNDLWVLTANNAGNALIVQGLTQFVELGADMSITTSAPTAPFDYGPGQPSVLLSLVGTFRAGLLDIRAAFCGFVQNNAASAVGENQAFVDIGLFVDGVMKGNAFQSFFFEQQPTAMAGPGKVYGFAGMIEPMPMRVTEGQHTIQLRWGASGAGPEVTAGIAAATPPVGATMQSNYARILAQEVPG